MTPDMMVVTDMGAGSRGTREPSSEILMHWPCTARPDIERRRPRASAGGHRVRRGRHSARSRGAGRSRDDAGQHSDCRLRHAVDPRAGRCGAPVHPGARRAAARESWRAHGRQRSLRGVLQDGDDRAFARISLVARLLGRERCCRARRWCACRGCAACTASRRPAPICADGPTERSPAAMPPARSCRRPRRRGRARSWPSDRAAMRARSGDGEIRLTYSELTALIEDAVRSLTSTRRRVRQSSAWSSGGQHG